MQERGQVRGPKFMYTHTPVYTLIFNVMYMVRSYR